MLEPLVQQNNDEMYFPASVYESPMYSSPINNQALYFVPSGCVPPSLNHHQSTPSPVRSSSSSESIRSSSLYHLDVNHQASIIISQLQVWLDPLLVQIKVEKCIAQKRLCLLFQKFMETETEGRTSRIPTLWDIRCYRFLGRRRRRQRKVEKEEMLNT